MRTWLAFAALALGISNPPQAQVVIRDSVTISAAPAALGTGDDCSGPELGELVYEPGPTASSFGSPLDAALTVYTSCGSATANLTEHYTLVEQRPYLWAPEVDRYSYERVPDAEILRLPLRRGVSVDSVVYRAGEFARTRAYPEGRLQSGDDIDGWIFGCYASSCGDSPPGFVLSTSVSVSGLGSRLGPSEWPSEVACGTTTPLPVTGMRDDGTEGYLPPRAATTMAFFGEGGQLRVSDELVEPVVEVPTTYGELMSGAMAYVAPGCDEAFETFDVFIGLIGRLTVRNRADVVDLWADSDNDGEHDAGDEVAEYADGRPGLLLPINDDDDNGDGTPDLEGPSGHADDDLLPIRVSGMTGPGTLLRLEPVGEVEGVRLWADAEKTTEIMLPHEWAGSTDPFEIYAEGIDWALERTVLRLSRWAETAPGSPELTAADTLGLYPAPTGVGLVETTTPGALPLGFVQGLPPGTEVRVTASLNGSTSGDSTFTVWAPVHAFEAPVLAGDVGLGDDVVVTVRADGGAVEIVSAPSEVVAGSPRSLSIVAVDASDPWVADGTSVRTVEVAVRDSLGHAVEAGVPVTLRAGKWVAGGVANSVQETDADGVVRFDVQAPVIGAAVLQASAGVAVSDTVRFTPETLALELVPYTPQVDVVHGMGMVALQTNARPGTPVEWSVSNGAGGVASQTPGVVEYGGSTLFQFSAAGARLGRSVVTATVGASTVAVALEMTSSAPFSVEAEYDLLAGDASADGVHTEAGTWEVPLRLQAEEGPWTPLGPTLPWEVEGEYMARTPVTVRGTPDATYAVSLVDSTHRALVDLHGLDGGSPGGFAALGGTGGGELTVGPDGTATFFVQSRGAFSPGQLREAVDIAIEYVRGGAPPAAWVAGDVGSGAAPGAWMLYSGSHYIQGGGDIGGTADAFHFASQTLPETGSITALVSYAAGPEDDLLAGLMVRASRDADAPYGLVALSKLGVHFDARATQGATAVRSASGSGTAGLTWLRLDRSGTAVTASTSPDGQTWATLGSMEIPGLGSDSVHVGLAVSAGAMDPTVTAFAGFGDVTVDGAPPAAAGGPAAALSQTDDEPATLRIYLAPSAEIAYYIDWLRGTLGGDPTTGVGYREYLEASRTGIVHGGVLALVKNYRRAYAQVWGWNRVLPDALEHEEVNVSESAAQLVNVAAYYIENFGDEAVAAVPELAAVIEPIRALLDLESLQKQAAYLASIGSFTDDSYFARHLATEWFRCASWINAAVLDCNGSLKDVVAFTEQVGERPGYVYYGGQAIDDSLSFAHAMSAQLAMGEELADAVDDAVRGDGPPTQNFVGLPATGGQAVPGGGTARAVLADDEREGLSDTYGKRFFEALAGSPALQGALNASDDEGRHLMALAYAIEDGRLEVPTLGVLFESPALFDPATWDGEAYTAEHLVEDLAAVAAAAADDVARDALRETLREAAREMNLPEPLRGHMYEVIAGSWLVRNEGVDSLRVGWQPPKKIEITLYNSTGRPHTRNIGRGDVDLYFAGHLYEAKSGEGSVEDVDAFKLYRLTGIANHLGFGAVGLVSPFPNEDSLPADTRKALGAARTAVEKSPSDATVGDVEYRSVPLTGRKP